MLGEFVLQTSNRLREQPEGVLHCAVSDSERDWNGGESAVRDLDVEIVLSPDRLGDLAKWRIRERQPPGCTVEVRLTHSGHTHRTPGDVDLPDAPSFKNLTPVRRLHRYAPTLDGHARISARIRAHVELGAEIPRLDVPSPHEKNAIRAMLDGERCLANQRR